MNKLQRQELMQILIVGLFVFGFMFISFGFTGKASLDVKGYFGDSSSGGEFGIDAPVGRCCDGVETCTNGQTQGECGAGDWAESGTCADTPCPGNCSSTITSSVTLTRNIGPCQDNGITIGSDTITFDCAGYRVAGVNRTANNESHYGIIINSAPYATLKNCNITNFSVGVYMDDSDNGKIINNTFNRNWLGVRLWDDSNYTIIENNTITLNNFTGLHIRQSGFNNVTNNTIIDNTGDMGIHLHLSAHNNLIENNTLVQNSGGMDIYYTSDNNLVENNVIHSNLADGIFVWFDAPNNNTIIDNRIYNNTYHGIYLNNATNTTIVNNTIVNNTQTGIYIEDSLNNTVVNNTIYNNSDYGLYMNKSFNTTVYQNLIWNNSDNGIYLNNSNYNNISSNTILGNLNYGIYVVRSDYNNITNNTVNNHTLDGIILSTSANNNRLINNIVYYNIQYGIYILANKNIVDNNTLFNNSATGIILGTVSDNNITNNFINNTRNTAGIYVFAISSSNRVVNNTISDTIGDGIIIENQGNSNVIINNTVYNNTRYGIYIADDSYYNVVGNNTVHNNSNYGVYLYNSADSNNLTSNVIRDNVAGGVYFSNSDSCIIKDNNFSNPGYWDIIFDQNSADNKFYNNTISYSGVYNTTFSFTEYYGKIKITGASSIPAKSDLNNISKYLNITNSSAAGLNLSIFYNDSDLSGITESRLGIYKYDGGWSKISNTSVNTRDNLVFGNITNFSIFGVFEAETSASPQPPTYPPSSSSPPPPVSVFPPPPPPPTVEKPGKPITDELDLDPIMLPIVLEFVKGAIIPDYIRSYWDNGTLIIDSGGKGKLSIDFEDGKPRFDFNFNKDGAESHYELPRGINWFYWKYAIIILCLFVMLKLFFIDREAGFIDQEIEPIFKEIVEIPKKKILKEEPVLIRNEIDDILNKLKNKFVYVKDKKLKLETISVKPKYRKIPGGQDIFDVRYFRDIKRKLTKIKIKPEKVELEKIDVRPKYRSLNIKQIKLKDDRLDKVSRLIKKGKIKEAEKLSKDL